MSNTLYKLFENVHQSLDLPTNDGDTYLTSENYSYFHYSCDGLNDIGFGCGYRVIQSISSMLETKLKRGTIPSIKTIQEILVKIGDKENSFIGSRDWIGSVEASFIFYELFDVSCKILHVSSHEKISSKSADIVNYFKNEGGLIFIGGNTDAAAKLITGIHISKSNQMYLLVVDPHFSRIPKSIDELINQSYVKWYSEDDFMENSFYNLCMPKFS